MITRTVSKHEVPRRALGPSLLVAMGLLLTGCSDEDDTSAEAPNTTVRCAHDVLEPDLEAGDPVGPAVDPESGKLRLERGETYMVSSTYGTPKPGADGKPVMDRYYELFGAIQTQLESQPGLLALWLSQSPACGSGRTLAVWKSEELMYDFVVSPPHLAAMNAVEDVLQPGYAVTHWEASTAEQVTFDEAVRQLAKAGVSP